MTAEKRVDALHVRMRSLRLRRERRKTAVMGALSGGLALCLGLLVFGQGMNHEAGTAGMYSGAMMLFENAGGYVLAAIVAFMAGVIVTVLCIRKRRVLHGGQPDANGRNRPPGSKRE